MTAGIVLSGLPTTVIDAYDAQDVANTSMGPGFHWTLSLSAQQQDALYWIHTQTPLDAIVQAEPTVRGREAWSVIPSFAGRRMAAGLPISLMHVPAYDTRSLAVHEIFAGPDPETARRLARELAIDYCTWMARTVPNIRASRSSIAGLICSSRCFAIAKSPCMPCDEGVGLKSMFMQRGARLGVPVVAVLAATVLAGQQTSPADPLWNRRTAGAGAFQTVFEVSGRSELGIYRVSPNPQDLRSVCDSQTQTEVAALDGAEREFRRLMALPPARRPLMDLAWAHRTLASFSPIKAKWSGPWTSSRRPPRSPARRPDPAR